MEYLQLIFDATTGKCLRMMSNSTLPDGDPNEAKDGEISVIERDPIKLANILNGKSVELQKGVIYITPKRQPGLAELQQHKLRVIKERTAREVVFSKAPDFKQRNVALGIYDAPTADKITNWILAVLAAVDEVEAQILASTNEVMLEAIDTTTTKLQSRAEAIYETLLPKP